MVLHPKIPHMSGYSPLAPISEEEAVRRYVAIWQIHHLYNERSNEPTMSAVCKQTLECAYELSGSYPDSGSAAGASTAPVPVDMRILAAMVGQDRNVVARAVAALVAAGLLVREEGRDPVTGQKVVALAAGRWPYAGETLAVPPRRRRPAADDAGPDATDATDHGATRDLGVTTASALLAGQNTHGRSASRLDRPNPTQQGAEQRSQPDSRAERRRARRKQGKR